MRLAILQQLEANQWRSAEEIRSLQFRQLNRLLRHVAKTVPFYRRRLDGCGLTGERAVTPEDWLRMPLLTRADIQQAGEELISDELPPEHGKTAKASTSGSTGMPVTVVSSHLNQLFWEVVTLREHLWQGRDLGGSMAVIRRIPKGASYPDGFTSKHWGAPVESVFPSGPLHALEIDTSVAQQAEWLTRVNPTYLRGYPTNLLSLARYFQDNGLELPRLKQCLTFGELLHPHVREACREAWGVEIADAYSSQELGYISLQAPGHEHQLVQADFVLLEVIDRDGRPCKPGEVGRVVATSLHNLAMPLLRYEIGDFAEVGGPCPTGRGLPVLTRILGRERNMLVDREGNEYWPAFGVKSMTKIVPLRQFQLAQVAVDKVEARLVPERPLSEDERRRLVTHLSERLPGTVSVELVLLEEIPRGAGGKYEDFVNETKQGKGDR
ncbi:AMP-binding protein [Pelagibius sp. CAU 1746]|uniref:phenylacetate--CoA ligase family protein n=1 Tax=Pelagibius sp. CAU 1746 TaxID=3140370 RepID=UPI00325B8D35